MLSGNPIVVSDIGGLNEIVDHCVNGMKSYAGNANSIADSILTLLFNQELAKSCVEKAQEKVRTQYNWTKIADDTHFIYEKAIAETVAEYQAKQIAQEQAKAVEAQNDKKDFSSLFPFKKSRSAYA